MLASVRAKIQQFSQKASFKYIAVLTFFMFVSRGLGLVRNLLIYQRFSGIDSDLLLASTKIPDLLVSLLIMGTISSSVLPVASRLEATDDKEHTKVSEYINLVYISIIAALILISIVIITFTPWFLEVTTSESAMNAFKDAGLYDNYLWMTRLLMLGPLTFATQGVFGVYLTLKERFTIYSWAGAIYNIGTIIGIMLFPFNYYAPAIGMMGGAVLNSILYIVDSKRGGIKFSSFNIGKYLKRALKTHKKDLISTWQVYVPRIFIINGLVAGNLLINRVTSDTGQIFAVDLALSIQGVFFSLITSASTVFFPNISRTFNSVKTSKRRQWKQFFYYLQGVGGVAAIGTVGTLLFAPLVLWVFELFGRGQDNAEYIILLTRISALAIVFQSLIEILSKYIYVKERIWQPAIISLTGFVVQMTLTFVLVSVVNFDSGIAVSTGILINFVVVFLYMFVVTAADRGRDIFESTRKGK